MTVPEFMELFDAYVAARADLRAIPDDEEVEQQQAITHCASLWQQLVNARRQVTA